MYVHTFICLQIHVITAVFQSVHTLSYHYDKLKTTNTPVKKGDFLMEYEVGCTYPRQERAQREEEYGGTTKGV